MYILEIIEAGAVQVAEAFKRSWCCGGTNCYDVSGVFRLVKTALSIVRFVVPIILIIMTSLDISKKILNPEEKEGQKKIMLRSIAALIVFLTPTLVRLLFKLIDWGQGVGADTNNLNQSLTQCWDGTESAMK